MKLAGRKVFVSSFSLLLLGAVALRAEGLRGRSGGPSRVGRLDKKHHVGSVADSQELLLACAEEAKSSGCDVIPADDTFAIAECLHHSGPASPACEARISGVSGVSRPLRKHAFEAIMGLPGDRRRSSSDSSDEDSSNEDSSNEDSSNEDSSNEDSSNEDSSDEDSSDENSSDEDSSDTVTSTSWFDSSDSSDSSESSVFSPDVKGQVVRKKPRAKDPRVVSPPSSSSRLGKRPGHREVHGLRGADGSESHERGSRTHFSARHSDHNHGHTHHYVVYAFIGACLLVQILLPIFLWSHQSTRPSSATGTVSPRSLSAVGGDYQAVPLVNSDAVADDDAVVVTGTPINPPPSAHV